MLGEMLVETLTLAASTRSSLCTGSAMSTAGIGGPVRTMDGADGLLRRRSQQPWADPAPRPSEPPVTWPGNL